MERMEELIPQEQKRWQAIKKTHGSKSLGEVTVDQVC